jgi:hypothetical protein
LKDWEVIADNLSKAGLSWGGVSAVDCENATKSELRQCPDSTDEKIAAPHAREV